MLAWYGAEVDNLRAMLDSLMDEAPAEAARATHAAFPVLEIVGAYSEAVSASSRCSTRKLTDDLRAQTLAYLAEAQRVGRRISTLRGRRRRGVAVVGSRNLCACVGLS